MTGYFRVITGRAAASRRELARCCHAEENRILSGKYFRGLRRPLCCSSAGRIIPFQQHLSTATGR
jgi:hypothetical protein